MNRWERLSDAEANSSHRINQDSYCTVLQNDCKVLSTGGIKSCHGIQKSKIALTRQERTLAVSGGRQYILSRGDCIRSPLFVLGD